jgi:hypothetical protein
MSVHIQDAIVQFSRAATIAASNVRQLAGMKWAVSADMQTVNDKLAGPKQ